MDLKQLPMRKREDNRRSRAHEEEWTSVRTTHAVLLVGLLSVGSIGLGCQSGPVLAWQGARHYARGNDALDREEPRIAIREFERAAELIPHASEVRNHLGLAYWAAGERKPARLAFEEAIELDCDNEAAKINLRRLEAVGLPRAESEGNASHVE